ncbi:SMI1/KNR4 family protein [Ruminococcus albus]|uniref:SMI1/KNR4 family protein n=1 Tax=Ruminococcus albus TaxID=1264 RepID=UPI000464D096|nr:SMI1/KNR4 family protein [Ruminococcus albus]
MQLIYTDDKGIRHEVLTSWNAMHDDFYYFGNAVNMPLEAEKNKGTSKYRLFLNGEADNREKSEARIAYLEQKYGIVFPEILKDLYSRTDCSGMRSCYIEIDHDFEVYDLVTLEDEVGGFEQLVDCIYRTEPLCRYIPDDWFPLAEDKDGNHFFWSSKTQQVYYGSCEEIEDKILIADSIEEFIDMLNDSVDMRPPEPVRSVVQANGCHWDITEQWDSCVIDRCVNNNSLKEVTVPSELNGKPVVSIGDNAFANDPVSLCRVIETLIMPDSIRHIGSFFFKRCIYLRHIKMPAGLESIGNEAFRGASGLETLAIGDNCISIGSLFCADAISLRTASIGAGIRNIGDYAFYNTPAMVGFRCDGELRSLGHGSFWMNKWADSQLFRPYAEMLCFGRNNSLLYRYVKHDPPMRLYFDDTIRYVFDHAFGGDVWNSGSGITDIYFPGADTVGLQSFKKVPYATVLSVRHEWRPHTVLTMRT